MAETMNLVSDNDDYDSSEENCIDDIVNKYIEETEQKVEKRKNRRNDFPEDFHDLYSLSDDDSVYQEPLVVSRRSPTLVPIEGHSSDLGCSPGNSNVIVINEDDSILGSKSPIRKLPSKRKPKEIKRKTDSLQEGRPIKISKTLQISDLLKTIQVEIDSNLINSEFGASITGTLEAFNIPYKNCSQAVSKTITWTQMNRSIENSDNNQILMILNCSELLNFIRTKTLVRHMQEVLKKCPTKKRLHLIVYGLEKYYRQQVNAQRKTYKKRIQNTAISNAADESFQLNKQQIQLALIDLYVQTKCSAQFVDNECKLAVLIEQFTRSIAQIPIKIEKWKSFESVRLYSSGELKDSVRVDPDGKNLRRLWQQILTTFPSAGLQTADAIMSVFPTPTSLINAFKKCTNESEAVALLQDVPVQRAGTVERKLGPELSRKIYRFFTATDGALHIS